jgi:hypothetical protein
MPKSLLADGLARIADDHIVAAMLKPFEASIAW